MNKIAKTMCPACLKYDTYKLHEIKNLPAIIFPVEIEKAFEVPARTLEITQCKRCGHIFQHSLDDDFIKEIYEKWYKYYPFSNLESMNDSYRIPFENFLLLTLRREIHHEYKSVLEIGCGEESQLMFYLSHGLEVTAINPTVPKSSRMKFIKGYYERADIKDKYDIIVSRFNLEHIGNVDEFFSSLKKNLKPKGRILIQVPNASRFLESGLLNIFVHEHVHYFSIQSLMLMAINNGFNVSNINSSNESSLIVELCMTTDDMDQDHINHSSSLVKTLISTMDGAHKRVVIYGSGLSLTKLLYEENISKYKDKIIIIDDNEALKGRVMPFSDLSISPLLVNSLEDVSDVILTLNPIYHQNVINRLRALSDNICIHVVENYSITRL